MSSPFWTYFHDKLNWLPIFRPGPVSAIMKGLALHLDEVRADILWLRKQWNPATCDEELVEKYGISRGITRNRFDTSESYRKRVVYAYAWHKLGGKVRGLERILAENGFNTAVLQASRKELWAHFRLLLELEDTIFAEPEATLFCYLALEYKAARSIIEEIRTRTTRELPVYVATAAINRSMAATRLWLEPEIPPALPVYCGLGSVGNTDFSPHPVQPNPGEPLLGPAIAFVMQTTTRSFICPKY